MARLEDEDALSELMIASLHSDLESAQSQLAIPDPRALVARASPKLRLTALHLAAFNNAVEIVRLLLAHGADALVKNSEGDSVRIVSAV